MPDAIPYTKVKLALCVRRSDLPKNFEPFSDPIHALRAVPSFFIDRALCENDPQYVQVLPYIVLRSHDKKRILSYRRPDTTNGEQRLRGLLSIGFGGHIDSLAAHAASLGDIRTLIYREGAREIQEETGIAFSVIHPLLTVANWAALFTPPKDDGSHQPVEVFHLGLATIVDLPKDLEVAFDHLEIHDPQWMTYEELVNLSDAMEAWSCRLIHHAISIVPKSSTPEEAQEWQA